MAKYGVVSTRNLLDDLRTWRHLYMAGRLQKPVVTLVSHVKELQAAQEANLQGATAAALLLLPRRFSTQVLSQAMWCQNVLSLLASVSVLNCIQDLCFTCSSAPRVMLYWYASCISAALHLECKMDI